MKTTDPAAAKAYVYDADAAPANDQAAVTTYVLAELAKEVHAARAAIAAQVRTIVSDTDPDPGATADAVAWEIIREELGVQLAAPPAAATV